MLWALIRNEIRLYRAAIIAALLLALLVEVIMPSIAVYSAMHEWRRGAFPRGEISPQLVIFQVNQGAKLGLIIACGFAAIFGGVSLPLERREPWAELPAMLPLGKVRRVGSKLGTGAILLLLIFLTHATILVLTNVLAARSVIRAGVPDALPYDFFFFDAWYLTRFLCLATVIFGLSWLGSTMLRSPTIVASIAIGIGYTALFVEWEMFSHDSVSHAHSRALAVACVGVIAFVLGCLTYARRVTP